MESPYRLIAPGNEKSIWRTFVPWNFRSVDITSRFRLARFRNVNVNMSPPAAYARGRTRTITRVQEHVDIISEGIPLQVLTYKNSIALKPSKILCMLRRHGHGCGKLSYDPPPALHACLDALSEFLQIRTSKESSKLIGLQSSLSRQAGRYQKLSYRKQIARKLVYGAASRINSY